MSKYLVKQFCEAAKSLALEGAISECLRSLDNALSCQDITVAEAIKIHTIHRDLQDKHPDEHRMYLNFLRNVQNEERRSA